MTVVKTRTTPAVDLKTKLSTKTTLATWTLTAAATPTTTIMTQMTTAAVGIMSPKQLILLLGIQLAKLWVQPPTLS
jgi:hypothetical protein